MSVTDELLKNNETYSVSHGRHPLPIKPAKELAVVACMDSRMDIFGMLGLQLGEAHVIRMPAAPSPTTCCARSSCRNGCSELKRSF